MKNKNTKLFYILSSFFLANAILAEFIGIKIFSLEKTIGIFELNLSLLIINNLSFDLTACVLVWPSCFYDD